MGCGESKHAVATENILTKSKSGTKNLEKTNSPPLQKPSNDDANVNNEKSEEGNENSTKKEDGKEKEVADQGDPEAGAGKIFGQAISVVEEKSIEGDGKNGEELKGEEKEEKAVVVVSNDESSKKGDDHHEEESLESLISEGISGRSDYYSPHAKGNVSERNHDEGNGDEVKLDKEKEEVIKVDEGKESSSLAGETKSPEEKKSSAAGNEEDTANATTDQVEAN